MFDSSVLSSNIKRFRKEKGLTQAELAGLLSVCPQSISKWERGDALPDVEKLCELSRCLGVFVDQLLGDSGENHIWMIGVDAGGSKTEFVLFNSDGEILRRIVKGGANPNLCGVDESLSVLKGGIDELLRIKASVKSIFIGIAGYTTNNGKMVESEIKKTYSRLNVKFDSDMCNAVVSVVIDKPCIASICGTGLVVYKYDGQKVKRLSAGYGNLLEKSGSGYNIGLQALQVALEYRDGVLEYSQMVSLVEQKLGGRVWEHIHEIYSEPSVYSFIASFAPIVFEAFKCGDKQAEKILNDNAERIAYLINCAYQENKETTNLLALMGSVHQSQTFRDLLEQRLDKNIKVLTSDMPPVYGSCLLACKLLGVNNEKVKDKFREEYAKIKGELK